MVAVMYEFGSRRAGALITSLLSHTVPHPHAATAREGRRFFRLVNKKAAERHLVWSFRIG